MQLTWQKEEPRQIDSYSSIAVLYDSIMSHVDYRGWADYYFILFCKHGHVPMRVLDISCGTGSLMLEFIRRGLHPFGSDNAPYMLSQAQKKLKSDNKLSKLFRADFSCLPIKQIFDTILCTYDSINYLSSINEAVNTVKNILERLAPNGVFIFDVCTEYNSIKHFNGKSSSGQIGDIAYTRYSYYRKTDRVQFTDFIITNKKTGEVTRERHKQNIFPVDQFHSALTRTIEYPIYAYKDFTLEPPEEQCERVHFYIEKCGL